MKDRAGTAYDICALAILTLVSGWMAFQIGNRGVETFDMVIAADGGWRVYNGQVPYRDFHVIMGPVLFYLQALFFWFTGGFSWSALLLHVAVANGVAIIATYYLSRRWHNRRLAMLLGALSGVSFYLPFSFPHYNYTAFVFFLLGLWAADGLSSHVARGHPRTLAGIVGVCAALSALTKQNIGFLAVCSLLAIVAVDARTSGRPLGTRVGPFIGAFLLIVATASIYYEWQGSFLKDIAGQGQADRLRQFGSLRHYFESIVSPYYLPALLSLGILGAASGMTAWVAARRAGEFPALLPLATRVIVVSSSMVVNRMTGAVHLVMDQALLGALLVYAIAWGERYFYDEGRLRTRRLTTAFLAGGSAFVAVGVIGLFHRSTVSPSELVLGRFSAGYAALVASFLVGGILMVAGLRAFARWMGEGARAWRLACGIGLVPLVLIYGIYSWRREAWTSLPIPEFRNVTYAMRAPALSGLKARDGVGRELDEVIDFVSRRIPHDERIFIFPSAQWLYGATGHESPRGTLVLPHWTVTYTRPDYDTPAIIAANPKWMIFPTPSGPHWRHRVQLYTAEYHWAHMPKLADYVRANFEVEAELTGFRILRRTTGASR